MNVDFEKSKLDLEYNNLLNWRSIVFASYFAILLLISSYIIKMIPDLMTGTIFIMSLSFTS